MGIWALFLNDVKRHSHLEKMRVLEIKLTLEICGKDLT